VTLSISNIAIVVVGYLISVVGGNLILEPIIGRLWKRYIPKHVNRHAPLPALVGMLDRFLYTTAILVGKEEFVAVWLVVKLAGEWTPSRDEVDRPLYHIFLIGNGLSIVIAAGVALLIQMLIRP
jgi:hypothetical protein